MTTPTLAIDITPRFSSTTNALSTDAEFILGVRHNRISALVLNTDAAITVYVGDERVSSSSFPLKAGASMTITTKGAVYAVAASGTPTVAIWEEYS